VGHKSWPVDPCDPSEWPLWPFDPSPLWSQRTTTWTRNSYTTVSCCTARFLFVLYCMLRMSYLTFLRNKHGKWSRACHTEKQSMPLMPLRRVSWDGGAWSVIDEVGRLFGRWELSVTTSRQLQCLCQCLMTGRQLAIRIIGWRRELDKPSNPQRLLPPKPIRRQFPSSTTAFGAQKYSCFNYNIQVLDSTGRVNLCQCLAGN